MKAKKGAGIVNLTVGNLHTVMLAYLLSFLALGLDPTITGRPAPQSCITCNSVPSCQMHLHSKQEGLEEFISVYYKG